jgi:hypothetical protein
MRVLSVRRRTTYRYAEPVELGEHRMMFRPRGSHDLRLIRTLLDITPIRRGPAGSISTRPTASSAIEISSASRSPGRRCRSCRCGALMWDPPGHAHACRSL